MKKQRKKSKPHDNADSKEICDICLDCPLPKCKIGECKRFRSEKNRIKSENKHGKGDKKKN